MLHICSNQTNGLPISAAPAPLASNSRSSCREVVPKRFKDGAWERKARAKGSKPPGSQGLMMMTTTIGWG